MKAIAKFKKDSSATEGPSEVVLPKATDIGVNQLGFIIVQNGSEIVGVFPPHSLLGVYFPEEPTGIIEATLVG